MKKGMKLFLSMVVILSMLGSLGITVSAEPTDTYVSIVGSSPSATGDGFPATLFYAWDPTVGYNGLGSLYLKNSGTTAGKFLLFTQNASTNVSFKLKGDASNISIGTIWDGFKYISTFTITNLEDGWKQYTATVQKQGAGWACPYGINIHGTNTGVWIDDLVITDGGANKVNDGTFTTGKIKGAATPTALPNSLVAVPSDDTLTISWTNGVAISGGIIYQIDGTTRTQVATVEAADAGATSTKVFSGLTRGATYTYQIETTTTAGVGLMQALKATVQANEDQTAPTLTVKTVTKDRVILNTVPASAAGVAPKYSKDGTNWQDSTTFKGLTANTSYTFRAYYPAKTGYNASPVTSVVQATSIDETASSWIPLISGGSSTADGYDDTVHFEYDKDTGYKKPGSIYAKNVLGDKGFLINFSYQGRNSSVPAGPVTVSFMLKGDESGVQFGAYWRWSAISGYTKENMGNGWTKYTRSVDTVFNNWDAFGFIIGKGAVNTGVWIDDLSIVASGGEENLIFDGGFDYGKKKVDNPPYNLMIHPMSEKLVFSWTNGCNLSSVNFYLINDGQRVYLPVSIPSDKLSENALVDVAFDSLDNGVNYNFEIDFTTTNNTVLTYALSGTPNVQDTTKIDGNYLGNGTNFVTTQNTAANGGRYADTKASIDKEVKKSGNSSLKVAANMGLTISGTYARLTMNMQGAEYGKTYQLSYYRKYIQATAFSLRENHATKTSDFWNTSKASRDWHKVTTTFTSTGSQELYLYVEGSVMGLWLDDVVVREVLTEGYGPNLVLNGGFEYDMGEVTTEGQAILWDYPYSLANSNAKTAEQSGANVYYQIGDEQPVKINDAVVESGSLTVPEIIFNNANKYYVYLVLNGVEQPSYAIVNASSMPGLRASDVVFDKINESYEVLKANLTTLEEGLIQAKVNIANYYTDSDADTVFYYAIYDGNKLVDLNAVTKTVQSSSSDTVTIAVNITNEVITGGYTVKAFIWKDGEMLPLGFAGVLPAALPQ